MDKYHKKNFIVCFLVTLIVCCIVLCTFLQWNEKRIITVNVSEIPDANQKEGLTYSVEEASYVLDPYTGNVLTIKGWCIIRGLEPRPVAIHVLLMDTETKKYFQLPTAIEKREDITAKFNDGINYDNCGYKVSINSSKLNLNNKQYEVNILYEIGQETLLVETGRLLTPEQETQS